MSNKITSQLTRLIHQQESNLTHSDELLSYIQQALSEEVLTYHLINKLLLISAEYQFIADAPKVCCEVLWKKKKSDKITMNIKI